jgi:multidrug efflux system membrane fusion protein
VYVVNSDGKVSLRKVALGPANGDLVSVTSGVKPGERVVIDGLDKLRDGSLVAVIDPNTNGSNDSAPKSPHRRRTPS